MNCNDCPNQIDSKCCHESIKPYATDYDKRVNDDADQHSQMMQEQIKQGR